MTADTRFSTELGPDQREGIMMGSTDPVESSPVDDNPAEHRSKRGLLILSGALLLALAASLAILLIATRGSGAGSRIDGLGSDGVFGVGTKMIPPEERDQAPEITGTSLDGDPISLDDFVGKVVVINVWGSWCAPCRAEAPVLRQVSNENRRRGVRFLGIDVRDQQAAALAFESHYKIRYPSIFDPSGETLLQFQNTIPPSAIPSTVVVDRDGRVAARIVGPTTYSQLSDLVDQVVAGK